jgi:ppGpp synthetase/RelA/SpoT-type nucleotidyltranferase
LAEVPMTMAGFNPIVEIQIRTGHGHSWAIQSHALTYKRKDIAMQFQTELQEISDMLYGVDKKWVEIRKKVDVALKNDERSNEN